LLYELVLGGALTSAVVPVLARSAERAASDPAEKARVGDITSALEASRPRKCRRASPVARVPEVDRAAGELGEFEADRAAGEFSAAAGLRRTEPG